MVVNAPAQVAVLIETFLVSMIVAVFVRGLPGFLTCRRPSFIQAIEFSGFHKSTSRQATIPPSYLDVGMGGYFEGFAVYTGEYASNRCRPHWVRPIPALSGVFNQFEQIEIHLAVVPKLYEVS